MARLERLLLTAGTAYGLEGLVLRLPARPPVCLLVVCSPPIEVGQDGIGLADLLEPGRCLWMGIPVRVALLRSDAKGALDLLGRRLRSHAEQTVVAVRITLPHVRPARFPAANIVRAWIWRQLGFTA